ncbi:hypothetical protein TNCV_2910221 [Trichonephila clavipes]|nr:hypothetical protein TNCV_2910221 [Trichonephila clavipes]
MTWKSKERRAISDGLYSTVAPNSDIRLMCLTTLFHRDTLILFDYATSEDGLPIWATEVDEIIDLLEPMNSDSDTEIDDEIPIKTATFSKALHCLETSLKENLKHTRQTWQMWALSSIIFGGGSPIPILKITCEDRERRKKVAKELTSAEGLASTKKRVSNRGHRDGVGAKRRAVASSSKHNAFCTYSICSARYYEKNQGQKWVQCCSSC